MRLFLLLAFAAPLTCLAQNWALINPDYKYNYSNDNTDTISNQVFVTQIDTLGPDSVLYALNRIGALCSACSNGYSCGGWSGTGTDMVHAGRSQGTGSTVRRSGSTWTIEREEDTLLILPQEPLGSTWTGPGNSTATLFAVADATLFGTADSLKHIAFSTGDTVVISKGHGIQAARHGSGAGGTLVLAGVDGAISVGKHYPRVLDLFDYGIGDVLQYHDQSQFQSSFCVHYVEGTSKYRILDRADSPGVTTYTMERVFNWLEESFNPQWWTPCGTDQGQGSETVNLVVDHEQFTEANFFASGIQGAIYPHALDSMSPIPGYPPSLGPLIVAALDSSQRVVIEPYTISPGGNDGASFCPSDQDAQVLLPFSDGTLTFSYCEGVGLVRYDYFSFESGNSRWLEGYVINGVQVGTITPDGVLLGIGSADAGPALEVHPNPATDHVTVQTKAPISAEWRIIGTDGRVYRSGRMHDAPRETIDVSTVPEGIYLLCITTATGRSSQRFAVIR